jgi:hypothetical protein
VFEKTNQIKQEIYSLKCKNEDMNFKLKHFKETNETLTNELEALKLKNKKLKESNNIDKRQLTDEEADYFKKIIEDNNNVI